VWGDNAEHIVGIAERELDHSPAGEEERHTAAAAGEPRILLVAVGTGPEGGEHRMAAEEVRHMAGEKGRHTVPAAELHMVVPGAERRRAVEEGRYTVVAAPRRSLLVVGDIGLEGEGERRIVAEVVADRNPPVAEAVADSNPPVAEVVARKADIHRKTLRSEMR